MQGKSLPEGRRGAARNGSKHPQEGNRHGRGRPSTVPLTANAENCAQVAALLMLEEPQAAEDAFLGEPLEAMLHVTRWCMANSEHPDYSPEQMLRGWAKKRGRGAWSDRPTRGAQIVHGEKEPDADLRDMDAKRENEVLAKALLRYWVERPQRFVAVLDEVEAAATGKRNGGRR